MPNLTKSEQYKAAAIALKLAEQLSENPRLMINLTATATYLETILPAQPWEYEWIEIVSSIKARELAKLAKSNN